MSKIKLTKDELLELVKESLKEYEVFFDDLPVDENVTLDMLVSSIYEMVNNLNDEDRERTLLISTCVLIYENFKLNFKKEQ